jgi:hypothetical protein
MTGYVSPAALAAAWQDWASHLLLSPSKQMELGMQAVANAQRWFGYGAAALAGAPADGIEPLAGGGPGTPGQLVAGMGSVAGAPGRPVAGAAGAAGRLAGCTRRLRDDALNAARKYYPARYRALSMPAKCYVWP